MNTSNLKILDSETLIAEQNRTLAAPRRRYGVLARFLFLFLDLFYGKRRTLSKFKVLEVIARVPYQAWEHVGYIAMTHTYPMPNFARRVFDFVKESRQQQDNEQWHLLILEEMSQKKGIKENMFLFFILPQIMAFFYYQISWLLYVIKPSWSYGLNADFEDHAEHEYMRFVNEHPEFESEPFESEFKEDYAPVKHLADLFRRIGLDERIHKEESLNRMQNPRFSSSDLPEGQRGGEWVAIQFVILAMILFAPPIFHLQFFPFFRYLGMALAVAGLALGFPSILYLGRSGTPFPRPVDKGRLVTSGPYHLVRHPVYFSVFLIMLGWGLWSQNLVRILLSIALFVFLDLKSKYEEDFLEKTYPEYQAYKNAVKRRFVPWLY